MKDTLPNFGVEQNVEGQRWNSESFLLALRNRSFLGGPQQSQDGGSFAYGILQL